jgi:hypothetical protein
LSAATDAPTDFQQEQHAGQQAKPVYQIDECKVHQVSVLKEYLPHRESGLRPQPSQSFRQVCASRNARTIIIKPKTSAYGYTLNIVCPTTKTPGNAKECEWVCSFVSF